jgi:hypothetical protein
LRENLNKKGKFIFGDFVSKIYETIVAWKKNNREADENTTGQVFNKGII